MLIHRGTHTPMFKTALSTIAKLWKEPKYPLTDEWVKNKLYIYNLYIYIYVYIYIYILVIKKNEILPFATIWMELECIMLSEKSQRKTNTI